MARKIASKTKMLADIDILLLVLNPDLVSCGDCGRLFPLGKMYTYSGGRLLHKECHLNRTKEKI